MGYTLNYDSIYGQSKHKSSTENKKIICNQKAINTSINKDICKKFHGGEWGAEIIIDSSGVLENTLKAKQIINENL